MEKPDASLSKPQHILIEGARRLDIEHQNGNVIETVDAHGLSLQQMR